MRFVEFSERCKALNSDMEFSYNANTSSVEFSNSGKRGLKHFSISLHALMSVLNDMLANLAEFELHPTYEQEVWRHLFEGFLTNSIARSQSTVQALPMFVVINKVLHVANNLDGSFADKTMSISEENISSAIEYLESQLSGDDVRNGEASQVVKSSLGENVIYYGAPGTGKSYAVDKLVVERYAVRTVFHADTQNSDFVGCLKPRMQGNDIRYEFRPGPFTSAIVNAALTPDSQHWLVIEEINRASAAAVFGEIFQLLDRNASTGSSAYSVSLADNDMLEYIQAAAPTALVNGKLKLPGNLSLLATMNSSDQAVMPLDTAFKRRWKFKYIPLNFTNCAQGQLSISDSEGVKGSISWGEFARGVNQILSNNGIPEDRHLGPFFLTQAELKDSIEALTGKLFMYLWDDVLRHGQTGLLFLPEIKTYGQLVVLVAEGKPVFNEAFYGVLPTNAISFNTVAASTNHIQAVNDSQSQMADAVAEDRSEYRVSSDE